MRSPYLEDFLKEVGHSVHNINTICVGLTSIDSGNYKKPKELTINWNTSDNAQSARRARKYALRSALIYVDDAFSNFLIDISSLSDNQIIYSILKNKNPVFIDNLSVKFKDEYPVLFKKLNITNPKKKKNLDSSDRTRALNDLFNFENEYSTTCVLLLNKWRNRVVHRKSVATLEPNEIKVLENYKDKIKENHSNIDILETVKHFDNNQITLKDITTLIAITIRTAREIDERVYSAMNNINSIEYYIKNKNLQKEYNQILENDNAEIKKRKFKRFIKTQVSDLNEITLEDLYSKSTILK